MSKERYNQIIDEVYESYLKNCLNTKWMKENFFFDGSSNHHLYLREEFINKCKTDKEFSERWELKIEERELSLEERFNLRYPGGKFSVFQENYPNTHKRNDPNGLLDAFNIPTKQTTIPYKNEKIVFYE